MKISVQDLNQAWLVFLDEIYVRSPDACYVRTNTKNVLAYSKVRTLVIRLLRNGTKLSPKQRGRAFDLAVLSLERQGYVERTPLGDGSDQTIDVTTDGDERLFDDVWPEFSEADLRE